MITKINPTTTKSAHKTIYPSSMKFYPMFGNSDHFVKQIAKDTSLTKEISELLTSISSNLFDEFQIPISGLAQDIVLENLHLCAKKIDKQIVIDLKYKYKEADYSINLLTRSKEKTLEELKKPEFEKKLKDLIEAESNNTFYNDELETDTFKRKKHRNH